MGRSRFRTVPRARPNLELAPSATTTYRARTERVVPVDFSVTTAPTQEGKAVPSGPWAGADPSRMGSRASVPCQTEAPALTARSFTMASRSWRVRV